MIAEFAGEKNKYYMVYGSKIGLETDCEETIKAYKTKKNADRRVRQLLAQPEYRLAMGGKSIPLMMGYMRMLYMI